MGSTTSSISHGLGLVNTLTGGAIPFLGTAGQVLNTVQAFQADDQAQDKQDQYYAQQDQALQQLQERQALQEQQKAQDAALEREKLATQSAQADEERRAALRRAVARQRAQFGSQGVSSGSGSSEAVLLGLFEESETERAKREQLDSLRSNAIGNDLAQTSSLNLLQVTQLAERNNLKRLF